MLIAVQKPTDEILRSLEGEQSVFLIGCKGCAKACECGGEKQVFAVRDILEAHDKSVVGLTVFRMVCDDLDVKAKLRYLRKKIEPADSLVVLSCGVGVQQVAAIVNKVVHPGNNTVPLGGVHAEWRQTNTCLECGDCVLDFTAGLCPITGCAKHLLHGPCGGSQNGKCEIQVGLDIACVWQQIIDRQTKLGRLEMLEQIKRPKGWSLYRINGTPLRALTEGRNAVAE